jgi:hypothetical protein
VLSLGPLLFIVYINNFSLKIGNISDVIMLADDTDVIFENNYGDFEQLFNFVLSHISKWLDADKPVLNVGKLIQ